MNTSIREMRKAIGWSLERLSANSNYSPEDIVEIEQGNDGDEFQERRNFLRVVMQLRYDMAKAEIPTGSGQLEKLMSIPETIFGMPMANRDVWKPLHKTGFNCHENHAEIECEAVAERFSPCSDREGQEGI